MAMYRRRRALVAADRGLVEDATLTGDDVRDDERLLATAAPQLSFATSNVGNGAWRDRRDEPLLLQLPASSQLTLPMLPERARELWKCRLPYVFVRRSARGSTGSWSSGAGITYEPDRPSCCWRKIAPNDLGSTPLVRMDCSSTSLLPSASSSLSESLRKSLPRLSRSSDTACRRWSRRLRHDFVDFRVLAGTATMDDEELLCARRLLGLAKHDAVSEPRSSSTLHTDGNRMSRPGDAVGVGDWRPWLRSLPENVVWRLAPEERLDEAPRTDAAGDVCANMAPYRFSPFPGARRAQPHYQATEVTRPTKLYMGGRAQAHYEWQSKGKQVLLTSNVRDQKFAETRWDSQPQRHRESGLWRCDRIDVAVQLFSSQRSKTDAGSAT